MGSSLSGNAFLSLAVEQSCRAAPFPEKFAVNLSVKLLLFLVVVCFFCCSNIRPWCVAQSSRHPCESLRSQSPRSISCSIEVTLDGSWTHPGHQEELPVSEAWTSQPTPASQERRGPEMQFTIDGGCVVGGHEMWRERWARRPWTLLPGLLFHPAAPQARPSTVSQHSGHPASAVFSEFCELPWPRNEISETQAGAVGTACLQPAGRKQR